MMKFLSGIQDVASIDASPFQRRTSVGPWSRASEAAATRVPFLRFIFQPFRPPFSFPHPSTLAMVTRQRRHDGSSQADLACSKWSDSSTGQSQNIACIVR
ncbi:putative serine/threonine-protein kinase SIK1B [Clarias magur]|uniref:Putative serine/threonine-protein kinase SIK1B n=1 Tax=Clarias magur TaxID=1594786 RepID=A0A8J4X7Q1_CLAMG|nr:putative serine/threonine-protein kinase SIK1B [Clarias magur]